MSLKSVEMQIALPRTQDAGKLQEQMQKQNQHFQESLAGIQMKKEEQKRKQVAKLEKTIGQKIKKENNQSLQQSEKESVDKANHPYLGKQIDLNL